MLKLKLSTLDQPEKLIIHTLGKQSKEGNSSMHSVLLILKNKNSVSRIFVQASQTTIMKNNQFKNIQKNGFFSGTVQTEPNQETTIFSL